MKIVQYFRDAYSELVHKVTWPSWDELQGSAILVMVTTLIIALVIAGMDVIIKYLLGLLY